MVARLRFDEVFRNERVRGMAVVAGSPILMTAVVPALVDGIHYMAVVACGGVASHVGSEVCDI